MTCSCGTCKLCIFFHIALIMPYFDLFRCHRGAGVRQRVTPTNKLPRSWSSFLREASNKRELFTFLADCASSLEVGGQVITTYGQDVRCTTPRETTSLSPCTHEEADTRMLLHAFDAVQQGHQRILLLTVDTCPGVGSCCIPSPVINVTRRTARDMGGIWNRHKSEIHSRTFNRK